jgi:hypothetical protein
VDEDDDGAIARGRSAADDGAEANAAAVDGVQVERGPRHRASTSVWERGRLQRAASLGSKDEI